LRIRNSVKLASAPSDPEIVRLLASVSESHLRELVEIIAVPRHFSAQPQNNKRIAEWIAREFQAYGYQTSYQGEWRNVLAFPNAEIQDSVILIGAHYDSVPTTPGADDNASAVAALLMCAKLVAEFAPHMPVCFVAFNREEDGLIGSEDFVKRYLPESRLKICEAHILEMIGYCQHSPDTQQIPAGLPIKIPTTGDFLGLVGNKDSNFLIDILLKQAKSYFPDFPVIGLKIYMGLEKRLPVLGRSDHDPFWEARVPALMWTDTAEFRNPNYHRPTDTPDTLDYSFLRQVTQLLLVHVLASAKKS
jgi:Zn-dependent M28 family amino/carboxypeptidase